MKRNSPKRNAAVSWMLLGIGAALALTGAMTGEEGNISLLLILGGLVMICGIVYHLVAVRCPHCGHSLAGYRPLPEECPKCHTPFHDHPGKEVTP